MSIPRVFISYSHDSEAHSLRVLELANRLRENGVEAYIDRYEVSPVEGWPMWSEKQIDEADFVLVVCTETYRRRFDGEEEEGRGRAAMFEGALITRALYEARENRKFIPVVFEDDIEFIPHPLRVYTYYRLPGGFDDLLRRLIGQQEIVAPPVGEMKVKPHPPAPEVRSKGAFKVSADRTLAGDIDDPGLPTRNVSHLLDLQQIWQNGRLSVVAGAGVSAASGLPTWNELLRNLLSAFVQRTYSFSDTSEIDSLVSELQQRLQDRSPIVYAQFLRSQFSEKDFIDLVYESLYPTHRSPEPTPICRSIARLGHHLNSILTFNYDELIESALSSEGYPNTPIFNASALSQIHGVPVYHPHGFLPSKRSDGVEYKIILAEADYHTQYHTPSLWNNIAISRVLLESVCLFVGTSLTDPNLRRLLDASHREQPHKTHYIIAKSPVADIDHKGVVSTAILEVFAASYQQMGVTPIWFADYTEIPSLIDKIRDLNFTG